MSAWSWIKHKAGAAAGAVGDAASWVGHEAADGARWVGHEACEGASWLGHEAKDLGEDCASGFFKGGDFLLNHGGQAVLDFAGFFPGVNILTEGAQAGYHALHGAFDAAEGDNREAAIESGEAAWHTGLAALNATTGEGGKIAEEAAHAGSWLHAAHQGIDGLELAHDVGATFGKNILGDDKVPFMGALVPWMLTGGAKDDGDGKDVSLGTVR